MFDLAPRRTPTEFELPGPETTIRRGEDGLIEPVCDGGLLALLKEWEPLAEVFPDVSEGFLPLCDVYIELLPTA